MRVCQEERKFALPASSGTRTATSRPISAHSQLCRGYVSIGSRIPPQDIRTAPLPIQSRPCRDRAALLGRAGSCLVAAALATAAVATAGRDWLPSPCRRAPRSMEQAWAGLADCRVDGPGSCYVAGLATVAVGNAGGVAAACAVADAAHGAAVHVPGLFCGKSLLRRPPGLIYPLRLQLSSVRRTAMQR